MTAPLALVGACAIDWIGNYGRVGAVPVAAMLCLATALGTLHGALWEGVLALCRRLPRALTGPAFIGLFGALAAALAHSLNAPQRLGGPYHELALRALVVCSVSGPGLGALVFAFAPSREQPLGMLTALRPAWRLAVALLLLALACALFAVDRRYLLGLYPQAHDAMRLVLLWLAAIGGALLLRANPPPRVLWLAPALLCGVALAVTERADDELWGIGQRAWPRLVLQTARSLTDFDGDGHSHVLGGTDCAPFDAAVHPNAVEVPGNGRDDNCLLGDAVPGVVRRQALQVPDEPAPMDVVLITIDSLQRQRLGTYSHLHGAEGLATTPTIDELARNALVFERAYSAGGWTSVSLSALMRGVYARRMQWTRMFETTSYRMLRGSELERLKPDEAVARMFPMPLDDPHPALPEWLAQRGVRTLAVVDDGFSQVLAPRTGIAPGFDSYRLLETDKSVARSDAGTAQLAVQALASVPVGQRYFLWVHFFGPHAPSKVNRGIRLDGRSIPQGYEHEIRYTDKMLASVLQAVEERAQPTAIFITADHGEEVTSSDRHHGWNLAPEVVDIPLIARVPGWPTGRSAVPVSHVDLMPTILALTQTPFPEGLDGQPIAALLQASGAATPRIMFADTWQYDQQAQLVDCEVAAFDGRTRAVLRPLEGAWSLTDIRGRRRWRPGITARSNEPCVQALAAYVESSGGTLRLRD